MVVISVNVYISETIKERYSSERMGNIFSDTNMFKKWLEVEVALAEAEAELGIIPDEAAKAISKLQVSDIDFEEIKANVRKTGHQLVPFINAIAKLCGEKGEFVHWGATTQDIVDTGIMLQLKEAHQIIVQDLELIKDALIKLSQEHKNTIMPGRTHGQHALPITFGFKSAVWLAEVKRHITRLKNREEQIFVGQLGGAVGTLASFGKNGVELQRIYCNKLDLKLPEITWQSSRDRVTEYLINLSMVAATFEKIASEVVVLQKTEVSELEEPFHMGKIGSSTMPHKRNPSKSENTVAISKAVRHNASLALEAMVSEHERDARVWRLELDLISRSCLMIGAVLENSISILSGLVVKPENMQANLNILKDLVLSEPIMLQLGRKIGLKKAHEIIYECSMKAYEKKSSLYEVIIEDNVLESAGMSLDEIKSTVSLESYLGFCSYFVDKVTEEEQ